MSRLKGRPAENSNVIFEFFFFLSTFIVMIPAMFLSKDYRSQNFPAT